MKSTDVHVRSPLRNWAASSWRALPLCIAGLASLFGASSAHADIWTFVDARGTAHFATTQIDSGYELFLRGTDSFTAGLRFAEGALQAGSGANAQPGPTSDRARTSVASHRLSTYFDISPGYKAVKHLLKEASAAHGIDYALLQALIATESGFNAQAVSPKGAVGLMQLIPPTADRYGVKAEKNRPVALQLTDPKVNIRAGSRYLRDLMALFPGQLELVLAAYNAGEGAVQRAGNKIPNYPETKNYVKTVMQLYNQLRPLQTSPMSSVTVMPGRVRMELPVHASRRGAAGLPVAAAAAMPATEPVSLPELY